MPAVLIRNLDAELIEKLKTQAAGKGRSLQAEMKDILENSTHQYSMEEFKSLAQEIQRKLNGRKHSDSGTLQHNGRRR
jgi:plasmid stability protein